MDAASGTCTISLNALVRSRSTLEDLTLTYLPLLGLPLPSLLKHLDIIVWLEASIYQLDEENEAWCTRRLMQPSHVHATTLEGLEPPLKGTPLSGEDSFIRNVLGERGCMDERIMGELKCGDSYWELERRITSALAHGYVLEATDVVRAHLDKSFDYRLLCLVFHRLFHLPYDEALIAFLNVDERLVDIADDLCDYEDDVEANTFNLMRCFVSLYGGRAGERMVELISGLEIDHTRLLKLLTTDQRSHWLKRHEESRGVNDGGVKWQLPCLILDEQVWRRGLQNESNQR